MGNVKIIVALRAILINKFQFAESAAQILRRNNQRTTFCKIQTIFMENPLKSRDFSGFSGRSVIIGFQKTQIYQWFAGSRQEVFILNCILIASY